MDLHALEELTRKMQAKSEISLITRIEMRILIRLLTQLKACRPENRSGEFNEFWNFYRHLPRSLVFGLGITELQALSYRVLYGERHE